MESKHTKGRWNVSKHGNYDSFGIYAEGKRNDFAIVKGGNEEGGEAEANAKLIAAAPDLLEALINAGKTIEVLASELNYRWFTEHLAPINNAIQKATE